MRKVTDPTCWVATTVINNMLASRSIAVKLSWANAAFSAFGMASAAVLSARIVASRWTFRNARFFKYLVLAGIVACLFARAASRARAGAFTVAQMARACRVHQWRCIVIFVGGAFRDAVGAVSFVGAHVVARRKGAA